MSRLLPRGGYDKYFQGHEITKISASVDSKLRVKNSNFYPQMLPSFLDYITRLWQCNKTHRYVNYFVKVYWKESYTLTMFEVNDTLYYNHFFHIPNQPLDRAAFGLEGRKYWEDANILTTKSQLSIPKLFNLVTSTHDKSF